MWFKSKEEPVTVVPEPPVEVVEPLPPLEDVFTVEESPSLSLNLPYLPPITLPSLSTLKQLFPEIPQKVYFLGAAAVAGLIASSLLSAYALRRHRKSTRSNTLRQTRYLIMYHFNTERLVIIRNIFMLNLVPFDIPTLSALHRVFLAHLDVSEGGTLGFKAFSELLQTLPVDPNPLFTLFDVNHDRQVDFLEFITVLATVFTAPAAQLFALAHASFDVHGIGLISMSSLSFLIYSLSPYRPVAAEETREWLRLKLAIPAAQQAVPVLSADMLCAVTQDNIMGISDLSGAEQWRVELAKAIGCIYDPAAKRLAPNLDAYFSQ